MEDCLGKLFLSNISQVLLFTTKNCDRHLMMREHNTVIVQSIRNFIILNFAPNINFAELNFLMPLVNDQLSLIYSWGC